MRLAVTHIAAAAWMVIATGLAHAQATPASPGAAGQRATPATPASPVARQAAPRPAQSAAAQRASGALAGQTVKLVRIDALTGLLGPVGVNQAKTYQYLVERMSGAGNPAGVKFEFQAVDNKLSPAESLNLLKSAIDSGVRYIIQGNGSSVALALSDAIQKHNERNPGKEVVYLNDAAVDPDLTNGKCSYWHFRLDADTSMKMEAMSSFMKDQPDIKNVYILGQNYSHGVQVARYMKDTLARKRPDVKIVGEDLHPLAQVRDFAPYIAKIKASGADTVVTGNWGNDLSLLLKAAQDGGYNGKWYTYYMGATGTPAAMGATGAGRVYQVANSMAYMSPQVMKLRDEFHARSGEDLSHWNAVRVLELLSQGMAKAGSTDPVKVAAAMEGLRFKSVTGAEVEMRKADHQMQQPLYMTVWQKTDGKWNNSQEGTGMTLAPLKEYPNYVSSTPTSCQMQRPAG